MQRYGIYGKLHKIIKNNYSTVKFSVKLSSGLTKLFSSNFGMKRGYILSPSLFNLFINDFLEPLDQTENYSVYIENTAINCLMYAGHTIMLSTTKEGLQNCLTSLQKYSEKWKLQVNTETPQVINFNKCGKLIKKSDFRFGNILLKTSWNTNI